MNARTDAGSLSWPRYSAYRTADPERGVSELPEHWDFKPLRHVISRIEQGWSPLCDNQPADLDEWGVLKAGAVNGTTLDESEQKRLPSELTPLPEYEIRAGDVLMSRANTRELLGSAAYVDSVRPRLMLCDKLYRLRVLSGGPMHPRFLVNFLRSHGGRAQFEREATGTSSSMQNIGQDAVLKVLLPVPPLREQEAILRFLDRETARLDGLIEKRRRMIALLQERRAALITDAVTRGLDSGAPLKDSGVEWLGQIPSEWEVLTLAKLTTKLTNGYVGPTRDMFVEAGVPYLQSLHIKDNSVQFGADYFVPRAWSNRHAKSILKSDDVLVVQTGDIGQVAHVGARWTGANCHALIICSPDGKRIGGRFLSWLLASRYGQAQFEALKTGALHPHLNCGNIKHMPIPVPPIPEQIRIAQYIDRETQRMRVMSERVQDSINVLSEYRASLITAAVTGQIDVRALAP